MEAFDDEELGDLSVALLEAERELGFLDSQPLPSDAAPEPCPDCLDGLCRGSALCPTCEGVGFRGIDPEQPCAAPRGSSLRIAVMAERYRRGLPIWNDDDSLE
jgi:hypothetical protein